MSRILDVLHFRCVQDTKFKISNRHLSNRTDFTPPEGGTPSVAPMNDFRTR